MGDGYLEIIDSTLTTNGLDLFITSYKIDSIANGFIFCSSYDLETGKFKDSYKFSHSKQLDKVTTNLYSKKQVFANISNSKLLKNHLIRKVVYSVYSYNDQLTNQYELDKSGLIKIVDNINSTVSQEHNSVKVDLTFDMISKLDLDNFVWTEKNFLMRSHAACHCLEIHYSLNSTMLYCRQEHNNYVKEILNKIDSR